MQLVTMAAKQPHLFTLMFGGHLSLHECGEELREESQASMQSLMKILSNGQKKDVFSQDNILRQTLSTMSIIYGFSMMATSGMLQDIPKDDRQLRAMAFNVYEVLLSGLKKR